MIILEKYSEEDFPLYAQLVYNEQAMNMNLGRVFTPDEAESFFQMMLACNSSGSTQGFYKVLLRQGEKTEYIGMGAMNWNDEYNAVEIEYMLLPEYWNHGYGRALVQHMLEISEAPTSRAILLLSPTLQTGIHSGYWSTKALCLSSNS